MASGLPTSRNTAAFMDFLPVFRISGILVPVLGDVLPSLPFGQHAQAGRERKRACDCAATNWGFIRGGVPPTIRPTFITKSRRRFPLSGARTYGRQDIRQVETAEPPRFGRAVARTPSVVLLRDGPHRRADQPAFRRRGDLLERGCALQHRADAASAI